MSNPNVDPSVRGTPPSVKDLRQKFIEIMNEEIVTPDYLDEEFEKAADRMMDAVAQVGIMDPE